MPYEESSGGNNHDKIHEISHGSRRSASSGSNSNGRKYLEVRQRPSGKWVAEIKDSSQKLRVWLGTFDRPEDAAASYDSAARLLRGRNAKTNFHNQGPAAAENRSLVVKNRRVYQMLRQAIMKNHTKSRDLEFDRRVEETIFCPSDSGQKIYGSGLSLGSSKVYSSVFVAPSFTAANCLCQVGAEEEEEDCSKESQSWVNKFFTFFPFLGYRIFHLLIHSL